MVPCLMVARREEALVASVRLVTMVMAWGVDKGEQHSD